MVFGFRFIINFSKLSRGATGSESMVFFFDLPQATFSKWTSCQATITTGHYSNRPLRRAQFGQISCKFVKFATIIGIFLPKICIKRLKTIQATFFVHLLSKLKSQAHLPSKPSKWEKNIPGNWDIDAGF